MGHLKYVFNEIAGVEIYPIISLLIFFLFFVALGLYVAFADKDHIKKVKQIPLEKDPVDPIGKEELV